MPENRRPTSVTLLALFSLALALWNGLRLVQAISFWNIIIEYEGKPGPLYLAISGGLWFIAGLSIAWGLWQRKTWAWFAAVFGFGGYGSWYWFDRLFLQEPHSNWPFALASTVFFLSCLGMMLRRSVILFFFQKSPSGFH